ncbi:MarC family protein [Planctomycetota bacterium]|nr:MarC family protein [Planctomycetota bacterium]MDC0852876.1 MarC family protein [Planctomycetota bacterium]MDC3251334.1 MarC family protein [Planctomycetota bacterium]
MEYADLVKAFGAFFAIMNPFVNLPIFLALTVGFTVAEQRSLAIKVTLFSAMMCAAILFAGQSILGFFGISVDEFRIAGGIVLAHIAWSMLNGSSAASHHGSEKEQGEIQNLSGLAFYPITFPMIVGPGTIATLIIYAGHAKGIEQTLEIGGIVGVILLLLFAVLFFASFFGKVLSDTMRVIMTRLMGMILLAIAVEMMVAGCKVVLPGLA